MFDELQCECELPIEGDLGEYGNYDFNKVTWQTKSLENCLGLFKIDKDLKLWTERSTGWYNDRPGQQKFWQEYNYYGVLRFYATLHGITSDLWLELQCKVDEGKVSAMKLIDFERASNAQRLADTKKLANTLKKLKRRRRKPLYKVYKVLWAVPVCYLFRKYRALSGWLVSKSWKVERFLTPF